MLLPPNCILSFHRKLSQTFSVWIENEFLSFAWRLFIKDNCFIDLYEFRIKLKSKCFHPPVVIISGRSHRVESYFSTSPCLACKRWLGKLLQCFLLHQHIFYDSITNFVLNMNNVVCLRRIWVKIVIIILVIEKQSGHNYLVGNVLVKWDLTLWIC